MGVPSGEALLSKLIDLYAHQEGLIIEYVIVDRPKEEIERMDRAMERKKKKS